VTSDLIYNGAHLYLQEHNLEGWLARLDEFDRFVAKSGIQTLYPGHGPAGGLSLVEGTREYLLAFATAVKRGMLTPLARRSVSGSRLPGWAVPDDVQPAGIFSGPRREVIDDVLEHLDDREREVLTLMTIAAWSLC
jgi:hypothetical protein